jgi:hypothetical protein
MFKGVFVVHLHAAVFELEVPVYVQWLLALVALLLPLLTLASMPITIGYQKTKSKPQTLHPTP